MTKAELAFDLWVTNNPTKGLRLNDMRVGFLAGYAALEAQLTTARNQTLDEAAQVAIEKGIRNGHAETCAAIADTIRELKTK